MPWSGRASRSWRSTGPSRRSSSASMPSLEGQDFADGVPKGARDLRLVASPGGGFVAGKGGLLGKDRPAGHLGRRELLPRRPGRRWHPAGCPRPGRDGVQRTDGGRRRPGHGQVGVRRRGQRGRASDPAPLTHRARAGRLTASAQRPVHRQTQIRRIVHRDRGGGGLGHRRRPGQKKRPSAPQAPWSSPTFRRRTTSTSQCGPGPSYSSRPSSGRCDRPGRGSSWATRTSIWAARAWSARPDSCRPRYPRRWKRRSVTRHRRSLPSPWSGVSPASTS